MSHATLTLMKKNLKEELNLEELSDMVIKQ